ncbi:MAG: phenylalanine--tRNA ligase subunit alpha, partial [Verrucomicrobia bacterium]
MHPLDHIRDDALADIASASDERVLESVRVKFLGRGGKLTEWSEKMRSLPKEEKPAIGRLLNEIRTVVTAAIESRTESFRAEKQSAAVANIDLSLPGTPHERGALHPLTQMLDRSIAIFRRMGFVLAEAPDIETEWHCF